MADGPIRTTYAAGGRRPIRHVHFEQTKNQDGTVTVSAMNGKISGTGPTADAAMQQAQQAQQEYFAKDQQANGDGMRRITDINQLATREHY